LQSCPCKRPNAKTQKFLAFKFTNARNFPLKCKEFILAFEIHGIDAYIQMQGQFLAYHSLHLIDARSFLTIDMLL
jgi:hypothetical protein